MADFQNPDPDFPRRESGSLLKAAIASTPLTVSVAAALHGIHVDGSIKQPREAAIDQAVSALHAKKPKGSPPIPDIQDGLRFMNQNKGQSGDIGRQAWRWATQSVDPFTRGQMLGLTDGIATMNDADMRSAITNTVHGNDSLAMNRIWNRFKRNVGILQQQATVGMPVFGGLSELPGFSHAQTVPLATPMPSSFQKGLTAIQSALGPDAKFSATGLTRPGLDAGMGIWNVTFTGTAVGEINVRLPQVTGGVMMEGAELQTRRIAPDFVSMGKGGSLERIGRTEMFLREFQEGIAPQVGGRLGTEREVERAVQQLSGKMFGELEAVSAVGAETRTAAQAQREALRGMSVQMVMPLDKRFGGAQYQPGYRRLTADEVSRAMMSTTGREMELTGGVGPKGLSKGLLSTADWERFYLGPVDYGRRPEQGFREFQVTEGTMERLGQARGPGKYHALQMQGDDVAYQMAARPRLKALYVNPDMYQETLEHMGMGEGTAGMLSTTIDDMQYTESVTQKLLTDETRKDIRSGAIKPGEVLGLTSEGQPFNLPAGANITDVRRISDYEVAVEMTRRHQLEHASRILHEKIRRERC
jgi:hypothetical protein